MSKQFVDGVYDISNAEYHSAAGISRSQLMLLNKSPYHFWYETYSGLAPEKEATPAMKLGSLFHTMLLEPDKFEREYFVISQKTMPAIDTNPYRLIKEEAAGREAITASTFEKAQQMAELCKKHGIVATVLEGAEFEQSIFWTDKETGLQFKARPDIWSASLVADLKTAEDVATYKFQRAAIDYGYYLQAAMIHEACKSLGRPVSTFASLVVEKSEPYVPKLFVMSDAAIQHGLDQFQALKHKLAKCIKNNEWEGYPVEELSIAPWAINTLDDE